MTGYRKYFYKSLRNRFADDAVLIIRETEKHFLEISPDVEFARFSSNPIDRRLEISAYFLALIKTLHLREENFAQIRETCLDIVTEYVQPKSRFQAWLKRLFPKISNYWVIQKLLVMFNKKVSRNSNPNGFIAKIITDKKETFGLGYGIDIMKCGICTLFGKHGYALYVPILCEVDKMTSAMAGLELVRKSTIALGAEKCDFRFILKDE